MLDREMREYERIMRQADEEFLKEKPKKKPLKNIKKQKNKIKNDNDIEDFYAEVRKNFPRWVRSEGPLKGYFIYWFERIGKQLFAHCTKTLKSKSPIEDIIEIEEVPIEMEWMNEIFKKGISIWGRKESQYDGIRRDYNKNTISEIITSTEFKYKNHYVTLYFVRYTGENLGTAEWLRASDLTGADKLIKEFEKEKSKKGDKISEYNISYNGITCKKFPNLEFLQFENEKMKNDNINSYHKNENNEENKFVNYESVEHMKFTTQYDIYDKNRKRNYEKHRKIIKNDTSCLFDCVNSLYCIWPKRALKILASGNDKSWKDVEIKIHKCISKFSPNYQLNMILSIEHAHGTLKNNIERMEFLDYLDCIVCYKVSGYITGHSGVLIKGKIQKMKIFDYEARKKLNAENYELVAQTRFLEDINLEIEEITIFSLKKTAE